MKLTRTASKAKNGLNRSSVLNLSNFHLSKKNNTVFFCAESKYTADFNTDNTHHDYYLEITPSEFLSLIEAANSSIGEEREMLKSVIRDNTADILKLLNMCAE